MNILISNDDGIFTEGLSKLVLEMSKLGDVYVIAPDRQRSGAGQSLIMTEMLEFRPYEIEGARLSYSFTGSPADCIKMGLPLLKERGIDIDLVIGGINYGGNLGLDTIYSGTVAVAREAFMHGILSIAVSVDNHSAKEFSYPARFIREFVEKIPQKLFREPEYMFNINIPDIEESKVKGVLVAKLGVRHYVDWFHPKEYEDGIITVSYGGSMVKTNINEDKIKNGSFTDVEAADMGYITITPIGYDGTVYGKFDDVMKIINED